MKKFLIHTAIALLGLIAINVLIHIGIGPDNDGNLSALLSKKELLRNMEGQRLILVGGSSVVYGYESNRIEEATGIPVINAGLHAGLGLDFYSNFIKAHVRTGDKVVLIPEYNLLVRKPRANRVFYLAGELAPEVLAYKPEGRGWINRVKVFVIINNLKVRRLILEVLGVEDQELTRASVSEKGDILNNDGQKPKSRIHAFSSVPEEIPEEVIHLINELHSHLAERGVELYISYPPLASIEYTDDVGVAQMDSELKNKLITILLNTPTDQRYNNDLFFDTYYHLNGEGRKLNTGRFLDVYNVSVSK
ncbi:MAG: hypothetical protein AAF693_18535 [Bacteroidota bacterium]